MRAALKGRREAGGGKGLADDGKLPQGHARSEIGLFHAPILANFVEFANDERQNSARFTATDCPNPSRPKSAVELAARYTC